MRILVCPASKMGGTAEIGRAIARQLRESGIDVDVSQPENVPDVSLYQGFVIGSALYMGDWLPQGRRFIDRFGPELQARPTWLFSSGPLGIGHPEEPISPETVTELLEQSGAVEHRLFGGRLVYDQLGRKDRFLAKWVRAPEGDYREWADIEQWVVEIATRLRTQASA